MRVRWVGHPEEAPPAVWDRVTGESGAPLFYRHRFLSALARHPLYPTTESRFVVVEDAGTAVGVLPAYRVRQASPLTAGPDADTGASWVSHLPHWYDSCVPGTAAVPATVLSLPRVLAEAGIDRLTLQNVGDPGLLGALRRAGHAPAHTDTRWSRDLTGLTWDDWLAGHGAATRRNVRRALRRADRAGWRRAVLAPAAADLPGVVELCRRSTRAHGNDEWLPAVATAGFVGALGDDVAVHEVRDSGGTLMAAAVGFADGGTYHSWSGGVAAAGPAATGVDANLLLYASEHEYALRTGCHRIEGGRRSGELKQRLGMRAVPLHTVVVDAA